MPTEKTIKVGDRVLWYGYDLVVKEVGDVVHVIDEEAAIKRQEARDEILALRPGQEDMKGEDHKEVAAKIKELDKIGQSAVVNAKLRRDLLKWWAEREVWVSDGRILTDEQIKEWVQMTGAKPLPEKQRAVLDLLSPLKKKQEN